MSAAMTKIDDIRAYVCGGRATFTIASVMTGVRYTWRVRQAEDRENFYFVDALTGSDNENDYTFLGTMRVVPGHVEPYQFYTSTKSPFGRSAPSVQGFLWFCHRIGQDADLDPERVLFWHSGRCSSCGRKLTTPESIERGMGPVCASRVTGGL